MAVLYRLGSVESLGGAARAWARGLPRDAMQAVLRRLGQAEILGGAGQVCRSWRPAVADEAELLRRGGEEGARPPASPSPVSPRASARGGGASRSWRTASGATGSFSTLASGNMTPISQILDIYLAHFCL